MLFDPKWASITTGDIWTLERLRDWLRARPNKRYDKWDAGKCLMAQYAQDSFGSEYISVGTVTGFTILNGRSVDFLIPSEITKIALSGWPSFAAASRRITRKLFWRQVRKTLFRTLNANKGQSE